MNLIRGRVRRIILHLECVAIIIAVISSVTHQFPGFSLRVCSSSSQSHEMEKILVQWSDGRWKGTTSFVKKSAVKKGTIAVGDKVGVIWGKSKKTYNAQVLDICSGIRSPDIPRQDANDEEPFTFELASPAPERALDLPSPPQPMLQARLEDESVFSLMEKMDKLVDAVSRVEARLLQRLDTLEEAVKKISERCVPHPQYLPMPSIPPAPLPMPPEISTSLPLSISYGQENFNSPTPVLQDASSRANIISPSVGEYTISSEELNLAMQGCRSRKKPGCSVSRKSVHNAGKNQQQLSRKTRKDGIGARETQSNIYNVYAPVPTSTAGDTADGRQRNEECRGRDLSEDEDTH